MKGLNGAVSVMKSVMKCIRGKKEVGGGYSTRLRGSVYVCMYVGLDILLLRASHDTEGGGEEEEEI